QAIWRPSLPDGAWRNATASFDREAGLNWRGREGLPPEWEIEVEGIHFRLSSTDFGHLGLFPEQRASWRWLRETVTAMAPRRLAVLNLFAYSGGSTMACALAGADVCHLDASKGMVDWARKNAELNGLKATPIRWIVDDAHKFLTREVKRGRRYDGVILDPPSFGRGAKGEVYKLERDLPQTLDLCRQVLSPSPAFVLLSAHTPGVTPLVLRHLLADALGPFAAAGDFTCGEMLLEGGEDVRPVPSGCMARWRALP
ncbi:MAG: class I SAM-dependent methyltransferase, partial [Kiritimatiellae bacterium]|nr:class I SAM-dependent methyltransferase [Kiritimatiellia bacterium]